MNTKDINNINKCDLCCFKTSTWSESLTESGHNGCRLLLCEYINNKPTNEQEMAAGINAEVLGLGWIKPGHICYNDQIIVRNVKSCKFFQERG